MTILGLSVKTDPCHQQEHLTTLEIVRLAIHKLKHEEFVRGYLTTRERRELARLRAIERRLAGATKN